MSAERRAAARLHPVLLALAIALGATALLGVLVGSLAQAHAAVTAGAQPVALAPAISAPAQAAAPADDAPVEYTPGVVLVKLKPEGSPWPSPARCRRKELMPVEPPTLRRLPWLACSVPTA